MDRFQGGCLCGAVRYSAARPIIAKRQCWCRDCQFLACGSATTNIIVRTANVEINGPLSEYRSSADSGSHMVRRFCPNCGTQLFSAAEENPTYLVIRCGTLDEPNIGAPEVIIWTTSAPEWARLATDLPHVAKQPGPVETLDSASNDQ